MSAHQFAPRVALTEDEPLDSELVPPALPPTTVSRPELVHHLDAATARKLVLVVAPPGYGKSVLLTQWVSANPGRRVAWMTVDPTDDANRFAGRLCATLSTADHRPRDAILDQVEYGGLGMGQGFISALLAHATMMPPTVLVLDDFHAIANTGLVADVAALIELSPPQLHFIIATRMDPALPYHRLRLNDEFAEVRQDHLAFNARHARELVMRVSDRELTDQQLDVLLDRTEGWAVGLQLAAISIRTVTEIDDFVAAFAGDDRHIAEYLSEHVLRDQRPSLREFLLHTSVLDRLSAPLCNAVTGRHDGQEMLEHLDRSSLFVHRIDAGREWFRYHQLFRTLLRQHLREADDDLVRSLLQRAADWHFAHGDVETAVDYLSTAGATQGVLDAVRAHGYVMYTSGRIAAVVRWLAAVTPDDDPERVDLCLLRAATHAMAGNTLVADAILDGLTADKSTTVGEQLVAEAIRTWPAHDQPSAARIVTAAERALTTLDLVDASEVPDILGMTTPDGIRKLSLVHGGVAAAYQGQERRARSDLQAASRLSTGHVGTDIDALGMEAILDVWAGLLRSAQHKGERALAIAEESAMVGHPATITALLALARVARERNDLSEAEMLLGSASGALQRTKPSTLLALHATEQALVALARADPERGLAILSDHRSANAPLPPPAVDSRFNATVALLLITTGDLDRAQEVLDGTPHLLGEVAAMGVRLAVERGDAELARRRLVTWPDEVPPGGRLEQALWQCVVDDLESGRQVADLRLADVVASARVESRVRIFLDAGPHALRLLRTLYHAQPSPFLRRLVDASFYAAAAPHRKVANLIEQLTGRERAILRYLPSRLTNTEIADELGISVNTLKTHLKHIYRKLGVDKRRTAISTAERLHLL